MVSSLLTHSGVVLVSCLIVGGLLQLFIARSADALVERRLFQCLFSVSCFLAVFLALREFATDLSPFQADAVSAAIILGGILPGALLIYYALRHNFLEFGAQRNLLYALSAISLAVLYLALVHRVSGWLASILPPEATASILLFALLFLFEPLERLIGPLLYKNFTARIGHLQRLSIEIQEQARQGRVAPLIAFAEEEIRKELSLAGVRISVPRQAMGKPLEIPGGLGHAVSIPLLKDKVEIGVLEAVSTGAYLTGETSAALEFLAEQLPAMIDLARLIEDKLRLERELAERERLALLGQMAASVSHNLRNPLSSMKTILQVQLEHSDLPLDARHDCALVVGEIDRMSEKLKQLLNFAKPSVNGQRIAAVALARQTAALFGRDAERRDVRMEFDSPAGEIMILASENAFTEALSNLLVNAIEAQPGGGRVRVSLLRGAEEAEVRVEDDGPGISAE
ncbi:MAG: sensor histidine kinase, partial [Candidatus Acidiferrales bacterium]